MADTNADHSNAPSPPPPEDPESAMSVEQDDQMATPQQQQQHLHQLQVQQQYIDHNNNLSIMVENLIDEKTQLEQQLNQFMNLCAQMEIPPPPTQS